MRLDGQLHYNFQTFARAARFLLLTGLITAGAVANAATMMNVKNVEKAILAQKAGWQPRDNWVNHLSRAEVQRLLGLKNAPNSNIQFSAPEKMQVLQTSTDSLDWRNKDGRNWISPIMNQGNCGSCVAFASVATLTTQMNISAAIPTLNPELSPQTLFSCGGGMCEYGWMPSDAADFLQETGIPDEACGPYTSGATGKDVACSATCKDSATRAVRIAGYTQPTRGVHNIDAIKSALKHGPLVTTLTVYSDFLTYGGGIYKHVTGDAVGGHAVSLVGFDDATRSFLVRNSWGPEWGENGFVRVSYDDISGISDETWSYTMPSSSGYVSVDSVRDNSYWSGTMPIHAFTTYPDATELDINVTDQTGHTVAGISCSSAKDCSGNIITTGFADGRYNIAATATKAGVALGTSLTNYFYVSNKPNQLALSFDGDSTSNLNKPVAGRIVFNITAQSTNVPMSHLIFSFKDASGKVSTRRAGLVLPQMTLGFRTTAIPNGTYEIWMTGHVQTQNADQTVETPHRQIVVKN
jgi:hypothetical protein